MFTNILQPTHLIIVLVIALLILGPKRLPEAGRALGRGLNEFKSSITGTSDDATEEAPDLDAARTHGTRRGDQSVQVEQETSP